MASSQAKMAKREPPRRSGRWASCLASWMNVVRITWLFLNESIRLMAGLLMISAKGDHACIACKDGMSRSLGRWGCSHGMARFFVSLVAPAEQVEGGHKIIRARVGEGGGESGCSAFLFSCLFERKRGRAQSKRLRSQTFLLMWLD